MKYEEGWDKIDHFISLNPVQKQPHQPEEWKQSSLHISPPSSSSPSWRRSCHAIETFAPAIEQLPLPPEESTLPGRASSDPGDPEFDEYHRSKDKTNGKDRKTMSEKSKSKSSDAIFKPSAPNQFSSRWERGAWSRPEKVNILYFHISVIIFRMIIVKCWLLCHFYE